MNRFVYDSAVTHRYPQLAAATVQVTGVDNRDADPALANEVLAEVVAARQGLATTPLSELAPIAAWRRVFTSFGTKPTQYRNAAESLLRRVVNGNELPALNTLADIGNLVSVRHALPIAVLDLAGIHQGITVRFADGAEPFRGVGTDDITTAQPGEVIFVDAGGVVHARRWCWRQSSAAATGPTTSAAIFVIEAHHEQGRQSVDAAATDIVDLLRTHQPSARASVRRLP